VNECMHACMNWVPVVLHGAPRRCDGWCHESVMFCSVQFSSVQFSSVHACVNIHLP